jgi:hypothetical protein
MASRKQGGRELSSKDYEKLGRLLESVFESGYYNHKRVYRINFARGLFFGLGSVLGGTIVLAILLWALSLFSEIPIIGNFVDAIETTVEQ